MKLTKRYEHHLMKMLKMRKEFEERSSKPVVTDPQKKEVLKLCKVVWSKQDHDKQKPTASYLLGIIKSIQNILEGYTK